MQWPRKNVFDLAEDFADSASPDSASRWLVGLAGALMLGGYGLVCIVTQRAYLLVRRRFQGWHEWTDENAVLLGATYVAIAAALHFHFFWSSHPRWHFIGQLGKIVALAAVAASILWFCFRVLAFS